MVESSVNSNDNDDMEEEGPIYQFRRIGSPATCKGVKDEFKVTVSTTKIGRQLDEVDFYLNSTVNKRLISRHHAQLERIHDGKQWRFILIDTSLNGTYVNDVKVSGQTELKVGDTVTFGHTNGINVRDGMVAWQPNSEFRFVFECVYSKTPSQKKPTQNLQSLSVDTTTAPSTYSQPPAQHQSQNPTVVPPKQDYRDQLQTMKSDERNTAYHQAQKIINDVKPMFANSTVSYVDQMRKQNTNVSNSAWLNEKYAQRAPVSTPNVGTKPHLPSQSYETPLAVSATQKTQNSRVNPVVSSASGKPTQKSDVYDFVDDFNDPKRQIANAANVADKIRRKSPPYSSSQSAESATGNGSSQKPFPENSLFTRFTETFAPPPAPPQPQRTPAAPRMMTPTPQVIEEKPVVPQLPMTTAPSVPQQLFPQPTIRTQPVQGIPPQPEPYIQKPTPSSNVVPPSAPPPVAKPAPIQLPQKVASVAPTIQSTAQHQPPSIPPSQPSTTVKVEPFTKTEQDKRLNKPTQKVSPVSVTDKSRHPREKERQEIIPPWVNNGPAPTSGRRTLTSMNSDLGFLSRLGSEEEPATSPVKVTTSPVKVKQEKYEKSSKSDSGYNRSEGTPSSEYNKTEDTMDEIRALFNAVQKTKPIREPVKEPPPPKVERKEKKPVVESSGGEDDDSDEESSSSDESSSSSSSDEQAEETQRAPVRKEKQIPQKSKSSAKHTSASKPSGSSKTSRDKVSKKKSSSKQVVKKKTQPPPVTHEKKKSRKRRHSDSSVSSSDSSDDDSDAESDRETRKPIVEKPKPTSKKSSGHSKSKQVSKTPHVSFKKKAVKPAPPVPAKKPKSKTSSKGKKAVVIYEEEMCDSSDCIRPSGSTIDWVQCDDCDLWYHTVCVGCNLEVVQKQNASFHCGCL